MKPVVRCHWVDLGKPDYIAYHDQEWGVPVWEDRRMFEFLTLESAQAGLSWYTVLKKRENYRKAFAEFDPEQVANFGSDKVSRLLQDSGIIRNRKKIEAAINNAQRFLELAATHGSFCSYLWSFVDGKPIVNHIRSSDPYPTRSPESDAMAKSLKQHGFRFVGTVICYAHMQATGMVNDHLVECFRHAEVGNANSVLRNPKI